MAFKIDIPEDEYKQSWSYSPGQAVQNNNDGTYTTSGGITLKNNYTTDQITPAMSYAIKQAGGDPNSIKAADKYAEDLLGRVGSVSANTGKVLTAQDIQNELTRLGYQVSTNGDWTNVGSQSYLTSGQDYDYLKDLYAKQGYGNVNIYTGQGLPGYGSNGGSYTASDAGGSYAGGVNYAGVDGYSSYVDAYMQALQNQLAYLDEQKKLAEDNADQEKRQAYVAMRLGQKALNEQNAASGLQDSGYSESSNIALTSDYGNNLNTIANNYQNYLNQLSGLYADTALSGAGTVADLQRQAEQDAFARQQYADRLAQQQWENQFAEKQYADKLAQQQLQNQLYQSENDLSQAKTRADAALNLGLWTPDVQTVYGLTEAQVKAALAQANFNKGSSPKSNSGGGSKEYVLNNVDTPTYPTTTRPANVQDEATAAKTAAARNNYANAIKQIEQTYGLTPAEAMAVYDSARKNNVSVSEIIAVYN